MGTPRHKSGGPGREWATVNGRIGWLVRSRFSGNRSALAKRIGFSHTVIASVMKGKRPGPRLLDAVAATLGVDPVWLNTGAGQPFRTGADADAAGIPVTTVLLPGRPLDHQALLTGGWVTVPRVATSPTVYWLSLTSTQPVVRQPAAGFRPGDQLLMETDPAAFPEEFGLCDDLCVLRDPGGAELRLATVTYHPADPEDGPARLEAEFPAPAVADTPEVVEHVYRHLRNGDIRFFERHLGGRGGGLKSAAAVIRYTDIVSVWLKLLRRPTG